MGCSRPPGPPPSSAEPARLDDRIVLETPLPGQVVTSPLVVRGRARGNWYFEATFPVSLLDSEGRSVGEGYATAQGEWMTTGYVGFEGRIEFAVPAGTGEASARGTLILRKANPSGLPEHDAALEASIRFRN